jgi:hypothetical protein
VLSKSFVKGNKQGLTEAWPGYYSAQRRLEEVVVKADGQMARIAIG